MISLVLSVADTAKVRQALVSWRQQSNDVFYCACAEPLAVSFIASTNRDRDEIVMGLLARELATIRHACLSVYQYASVGCDERGCGIPETEVGVMTIYNYVQSYPGTYVIYSRTNDCRR